MKTWIHLRSAVWTFPSFQKVLGRPAKTILILNILQLAHPCSSFFSCIFATLWFCSSQNNYCTSSLHDFPKTSHDGKIPIVGCQPLFWWSHISCLRCSSFNMWSTPLVDHHPWIITRWTVYTPVFLLYTSMIQIFIGQQCEMPIFHLSIPQKNPYVSTIFHG